MTQRALPYVAFTGIVVALTLVDLAVSRRHNGSMTLRRAMTWSAIWIGIAVAFGFWIGMTRGEEDALAFFTAYLIEESLSLDNMVVFAAIFSSFAVPIQYQRDVLTLGVLGAIAMRAVAIFAGIALIENLSWVSAVFGAFLIIGSVRLLLRRNAGATRATAIPALVGRVIPVTPTFHDGAYFWRTNGGWSVTPLFLALLAIELSDIVFATDSIPAVLGATRDPFLVFTSNMLAILGLRSLYALVAGAIPRLRYIRFGMSAILAFVGAKMLLADVVAISTRVSLAVIGLALATTVVASLWARHRVVTRGL